MKKSVQSNLPEEGSPKRQEWGLINQYKALEFEKYLQREKQLEHDKKVQFKQQLDNQVNNKSNKHQEELDADRRYCQMLIKKGEEQRIREEHEHNERIRRKKEMDSENHQHHLQDLNNSRHRGKDSGYHLDIGHQSQIQRKNKSLLIRKQVLDSLEEQVKQKQEEKEHQRQKQKLIDHQNSKRHFLDLDRRNVSKSYLQNMQVYEQFEQIENEKKQKRNQMYQNLVGKAAEEKRREEELKEQIKKKKNMDLKEEMQETLENQVKFRNMKNAADHMENPEGHSYQLLNGVYQDKRKYYNKQQYYEELSKQAQQHRKRKQKANFMTEQEYRLNINQLNKAVTGDYAHENYIDRTLGTVGDRKQLKMDEVHDRIDNNDANAIKGRIEYLKQKELARGPTKNGFITG